MNLKAAIANSLWSATNLPSYLQFRRALQQPEIAQHKLLQTYLDQNVQTAFGQAHDFNSIRSYKNFTKRVPLMDYEDLEPWVGQLGFKQVQDRLRGQFAVGSVSGEGASF